MGIYETLLCCYMLFALIAMAYCGWSLREITFKFQEDCQVNGKNAKAIRRKEKQHAERRLTQGANDFMEFISEERLIERLKFALTILRGKKIEVSRHY